MRSHLSLQLMLDPLEPSGLIEVTGIAQWEAVGGNQMAAENVVRRHTNIHSLWRLGHWSIWKSVSESFLRVSRLHVPDTSIHLSLAMKEISA